MTRSARPSASPFSDDDGYYPRDPSAINLRINDELGGLLVHLHTLHEAIESLDAVQHPEQQALIDELRTEVRALSGSSKLLSELLSELLTYNKALNEQRQSARKAFEAGYEARYVDILTQLHPADRKMLAWVVKHVVHTDTEHKSHTDNEIFF